MRKNLSFWKTLFLGSLFTFVFGVVEGEGGGSTSDDDTGGKEGGEDTKPNVDGDKKPSDEEARLLKENMQKKEQLKKAAEEKAALEAKLKQFEGIDPDAIRKLLNEQKDTETKHLEAKGDWERLKTRMAEEHAKEIDSLKSQIVALQTDNGKAASIINELSIGSKFSQSQFISDELTLTPAKTRVIYGDYFDLENGEVVGYDKPRGAANRTAIVDQYGATVGFDAALRKIVEADPEKDHLLKSKIKPGAGSDSKKGSGPAADDKALTSSVDKIAAGLKSLKIGQ